MLNLLCKICPTHSLSLPVNSSNTKRQISFTVFFNIDHRFRHECPVKVRSRSLLFILYIFKVFSETYDFPYQISIIQKKFHLIILLYYLRIHHFSSGTRMHGRFRLTSMHVTRIIGYSFYRYLIIPFQHYAGTERLPFLLMSCLFLIFLPAC